VSIVTTTSPEGPTTQEYGAVFDGSFYLEKEGGISPLSDFAITFWIKDIDFLGSPSNTVTLLRTFGDYPLVVKAQSPDVLILSFGDPSTDVSITLSDPFDSSWVLISIWRDGDELTVYRGGLTQTTTPLAVPADNIDVDSLLIGWENPDRLARFDLYDFRLYSQKLYDNIPSLLFSDMKFNDGNKTLPPV